MYIIRSENGVIIRMNIGATSGVKSIMIDVGGQCGSSAPPKMPALSDVIRCFGVTKAAPHRSEGSEQLDIDKIIVNRFLSHSENNKFPPDHS